MAFEFNPQPASPAAAPTFAGTPAVTPVAEQQALLPLKPSPRFYYMAHPSRWECVEGADGWEWLPRLGKMKLTPGVGGVRQGRGRHGQIDDTLARMHKEKNGWILIPYEVIEGGYCWSYQGKRGTVHLSRWNNPKMVGNQVLMQTDTAGFNAFRRGLVENGHIAPPDPEMLELLMDRQTKENNERGGKAHIPAIAVQLKAGEDRLEGMKAAAPKAGKRKRKRAPRKTTKTADE